MDVDHRHTFPETPGLCAGIIKCAGGGLAIISDIHRKGRIDFLPWRSRYRGGILPDQQGYERRDRIRRQLDDPDSGKLSWSMEAVGSVGGDLSASCGRVCRLPDDKEDVRKVRASFCAVSCSGISVERGVRGVEIF